MKNMGNKEKDIEKNNFISSPFTHISFVKPVWFRGDG